MSEINPPKYSKKEVSQKFNLKKLLGYEPSEEQKKLFYELAVDKMTERTLRGKDIDGNDFRMYSKEYAKSKGVSRNSVDLVLEGDMLNSFQESIVSKNVIKIKVEEGVNTLKSYNHNVGDTLPKRTYFGFKSQEDIDDVLSIVDSRRDRASSDAKEERINLADLRRALSGIGIDTEGFDGQN